MPTTQQITLSLPVDLAHEIKQRVASGEYASETEVIQAGLHALMATERATEGWIQAHVLPAYDALKANPSRGLTGDQVRARLGLSFD